MTVSIKPSSTTKLFYQSSHLCSSVGSSTMRLVLAQGVAIGQLSNTLNAQLYQLDCAQSVIGSGTQLASYRYTPFGKPSTDMALLLSSFVGQRFDDMSGGYLLGNGRRLYKPGIFRFTSSDTLSPFGKGGPNSYTYCQGDPVNKHDPSGQIDVLQKIFDFGSMIVTRILEPLRMAIYETLLPTILRDIDRAAASTVRHAVSQLTPGLHLVEPPMRDMITAAAAVPTPLSLRANALAQSREIPSNGNQPQPIENPTTLAPESTAIRNNELNG